jgi:hypothetical protein
VSESVAVFSWGLQSMEIKEISSVSYSDVFKLVQSFISLDISVHATGWGKWLNGEYTTGIYAIKTGEHDEVGRRREFRQFLLGLFGDVEYEYLFVEDIIGSVNFKTAKILYQLNPLADDMIDDGVLKAQQIIREDNKSWKSSLNKCAGYKSDIRAEKNDKVIAMESLYLLGFGDRTTNITPEGVYDATGLAVGILFKKFIARGVKTTKRLKKDVSKVYKIHQFSDYYQALDDANELGGEIHEVDFMRIRKDLRYNFKKLIEDLDDDRKTYLISIQTCKIGALALEKGLDLDIETSYLVIYR